MSAPRPERLIAILVLLALVAGAVLVAGLLASSAPPVAPATDGARVEGAPAVVERVADGDTIVVMIEGIRERVRYVGLDAPEIANAEDGTPAECGGDEARTANADLVEEREVVLERDTSDRDRFGRLLRHVWLRAGDGWLHAGEALAAIGAVEARSYPPDVRHDERLDAAERRARDAGLGIWGSC